MNPLHSSHPQILLFKLHWWSRWIQFVMSAGSEWTYIQTVLTWNKTFTSLQAPVGLQRERVRARLYILIVHFHCLFMHTGGGVKRGSLHVNSQWKTLEFKAQDNKNMAWPPSTFQPPMLLDLLVSLSLLLWRGQDKFRYIMLYSILLNHTNIILHVSLAP